MNRISAPAIASIVVAPLNVSILRRLQTCDIRIYVVLDDGSKCDACVYFACCHKDRVLNIHYFFELRTGIVRIPVVSMRLVSTCT